MSAFFRIVVLVCALLPAPAFAARLALVVGIDEYDMLPPLDKAVGDAESMSARLTELGFEVTRVINPGRRELNQAITAFRRALQPGDAAFVHYSGHGVEVAGRNLLLPRDTPIPTAGDEDYLIEEAIDLHDMMLRVAESGADVRIFVIDACRNNPFARRGVRGLGTSGGLAMASPPSGSFVLYSAGFQQTALDRLGPDDASDTSVYTRVLLDRLAVPGASISEIARSVRVDVAALALSVGHQQSPAYYDELSGDFVINVNVANVPDHALETDAFDRAQALGTIAAWEAFLENFPEGVFADLARTALADLSPDASSAKPNAADVLLGRFEARQEIEARWRDAQPLALAGDDAGAFRLLSEAMELAEQHFGPDSMEFAQANNFMVGAFSSIGETDAAIAASRKAIEIYTGRIGASDLRVLGEKGNLASRLASIGMTGEARQLFEEILATYETLNLGGHDAVAHVHALEGYSQLLVRTGRVEEALVVARRATAMLKATGIPPAIDYGWTMLNEADIARRAGDCRGSLATLEEAKASMEAAGVAPGQRDHAQIIQLLRSKCG
jgi:tetratricopeptide (TPR) repeat protein